MLRPRNSLSQDLKELRKTPSQVRSDRHGFSSQARLVDSALDSDAAYSLVRKWADNCLTRHQRCSESIYTNPPSRLLEIIDSKIYLRASSDLQVAEPRYVAVSYCWGTEGSNLETTRETLQAHQQGIKILSPGLPKTLRDAILVAKQMGLSFIWIDCLCIIQDSVPDKHAEIRCMGDYCRNAFLTIAVLDATAVSEGFLDSRPALPSHRSFPGTDMYFRFAYQSRDTVFREALLNTRGWTLQEHLLSRRIVYYGKDEIFWECLSCLGRESSFEIEDVTWKGSGMSFTRNALIGSRYVEHEAVDLLVVWHQVVKEYSRRRLTCQSDKRDAILGLASLVEKKTRDKFLEGGIITGDLAAVLFLEETTALAGPQQLPRPSWSWLATSSPVFFPFMDKTRVLHEWDATFLDENRTEDGDLRLTVRARRKSVRQPEDPMLIRSAQYNHAFVDIYGCHVCSLIFDHIYEPTLLEDAELSALWICEYTHLTTRRHTEPACSCGDGEAQETVTYFILIGPDIKYPACWRKVGVAAAWSRPSCYRNHVQSTAFYDSTWETITLV